MSGFIGSEQNPKPKDWDNVEWGKIEPCRGFRRAKKIIHLLPKKGTHLDIGTGNGDGTCVFSQYKPTIGIEYGSLSILLAKSKKNEVVQSDSRELPFKDNSFGSISCLDVLEHIPFPEKVIEEMARVLENEGYLILQTPIKETFKERILFFLRKTHIKKQKQPYDHPLPLKEIRERLKENGFFIIKEYPIRYWASNPLIHLISISRVFYCQLHK